MTSDCAHYTGTYCLIGPFKMRQLTLQPERLLQIHQNYLCSQSSSQPTISVWSGKTQSGHVLRFVNFVARASGVPAISTRSVGNSTGRTLAITSWNNVNNSCASMFSLGPGTFCVLVSRRRECRNPANVSAWTSDTKSFCCR